MGNPLTKLLNRAIEKGPEIAEFSVDLLEDLLNKGIIKKFSDFENMSQEDLLAAKALRDRQLLEAETNKPLNIKIDKQPEEVDIFADDIVQVEDAVPTKQISPEIDFSNKFILEQTGMDSQTFLDAFKKSTSDVQVNILKNPQYAQALKILTEPVENQKIRLRDILVNPSERVNRTILNHYYLNNPETVDFANQINNLVMIPSKGGTKKYPNEVIAKFADIYNSSNPFEINAFKTILGPQNFRTFMKAIRKSKLVSKDTLRKNKTLEYKSASVVTDYMVGRTYELLKKYKEMVPKATGQELKGGPNSLGEFDVFQLLSQDKEIREFLTAPAIRGKDDAAALRRKKETLLKRLNQEGLIKELGLDKYFLKGVNPKVTTSNDPKTIAFLKSLEKNERETLKSIKTSTILDALNDNQRDFFNDMRINIVGKVVGDQPLPLLKQYQKTRKNFNSQVNAVIEQNFGRMMKYGIREGKSFDEVFESFERQVNDPDFAKKVVPLILKTVKVRDKIRYNNIRFGLDIDDVNFSHKKAVLEDIEGTFKIQNIFMGKEKLNAAENYIKQKMSSLKNKLNQKGGKILNLSETEEKAIEREIRDLQFELDNGGYYDAVQEEAIDDLISDVMEKNYEIATQMKDGGFASIEEVLEYQNG